MAEQLKVGDIVCRKSTREHTQSGIIISINQYNKAQVKWDEKASNGQQHSTLDLKVLKLKPKHG